MRVDDESFCSFFLLLQQHQVPGTKGGWAVLIYTWSSSCIFPQCGDSVINQDMGWPWTPSYKYARSARPLLLCSFSPAKSVHPLFVQIIPPEIRLQFSWPQIVNILVDEVFVLNFLMFLEGGRVRAFFCFSRFSWFFFFFFFEHVNASSSRFFRGCKNSRIVTERPRMFIQNALISEKSGKKSLRCELWELWRPWHRKPK